MGSGRGRAVRSPIHAPSSDGDWQRDRAQFVPALGGRHGLCAGAYELTNAAADRATIARSAVTGLPSPKWGEVPLAVVVKNDPDLSETDVLEWCKGKLAAFKRPKVAVFIDAIPRNPTGKILKRVLRDTYETSLTAPE